MNFEDKARATLASLTADQILDRLADWHDGESREPSMTRHWALCWALDLVHEGHSPAIVLATLRGES